MPLIELTHITKHFQVINRREGLAGACGAMMNSRWTSLPTKTQCHEEAQIIFNKTSEAPHCGETSEV